jgi:hypothetical protein
VDEPAHPRVRRITAMELVPREEDVEPTSSSSGGGASTRRPSGPTITLATRSAPAPKRSAAESYEELYRGIASGQVDFERKGARFVRGTVAAETLAKALVGG